MEKQSCAKFVDGIQHVGIPTLDLKSQSLSTLNSDSISALELKQEQEFMLVLLKLEVQNLKFTKEKEQK